MKGNEKCKIVIYGIVELIFKDFFLLLLFFFTFLVLLCLTFSKHATAECELCFVMLVMTRQAVMASPRSPVSVIDRTEAGRREIQMLNTPN